MGWVGALRRSLGWSLGHSWVPLGRLWHVCGCLYGGGVGIFGPPLAKRWGPRVASHRKARERRGPGETERREKRRRGKGGRGPVAIDTCAGRDTAQAHQAPARRKTQTRTNGKRGKGEGQGRQNEERRNKNNPQTVKPFPKGRSTHKFAKPTILVCVPQ